MKKKLLSGILLCIVFTTLLSLTTFAASPRSTLLTYSGSNIRSKASVNTFTISGDRTVTVHHRTSSWTSYDPGVYLKVALQKKGFLGYGDVGSKNYYGITSGTQVHSIAKGTYRLYFTAYTSTGSGVSGATISGSVTG